MTVALLVFTDGRSDYHSRSIDSALEHLPTFDQYIVVNDAAHERGFAGAIQHAWEQVTTDWCFHLEADFTFDRYVPVLWMIHLLARHPHLAQFCLKRQPWNASEQAAGGIVELHPDDYSEIESPAGVWTEHRKFFSTNPSVYSSQLCRLGWPQAPQSEGVFTHRLLKDPALRFAFWGRKFAPPLVQHIGGVRAGAGY